jgi:hypothetical protein
MPASRHSFSSSGSICRDASEMSVSPAQNRSKPPPVPDVPTVTRASGFAAWKSSAARVASGATVLEPSASTEPLTASPELPVFAAG